ncbi:MAG TPA: putative nucleotidyltransferase substrate binding domain-containing protein [Solirubrobacteraceae bacterium]|nr:putative nucleotidyltransferase substrate binding domain-containing protein [Solirubrobacteraceae bacterium]
MSANDALAAVRFLRDHPPFHALPEATVERVAAASELETLPAGTTIFAQGGGPLEHLRIIREGAVEIVSDGRVLDLLGPGEPFGHASMLSGFPPGFEARAAEDTVCLRIESAVAEELLSGPAGLRFVARSLLEPPTDLHAIVTAPGLDRTDQPVGRLLRSAPVLVTATTTIRDAAAAMTAARASCAVIDLGDGSLGILTDRDLRTRVLAGGLGGDAPVARAMSAPAYTCTAERSAGDVLLEMLDRGLRHFPVLSAHGRLLGVIEDLDLIAAGTRGSFFLRGRIDAARSVSELVRIAAELRPMVIALLDSGAQASGAAAVYSVAVDAITRRLLELALTHRDPPAAEFTWLALGSQARREAFPGSDVDSAVAWFDTGERPVDAGAVRAELLALAQTVTADLERCGLTIDTHGASASSAPFVRSLSSWQGLAASWIADPSQPKALILTSTLIDSRPLWGVHAGNPVADSFRGAAHRQALLRLLARFALSHRPPTGFLRGLVVEHSGSHRGRLDLKTGGLVPIIDLARYAAMAAGVTSASTAERLRAAAAAGTLAASDAHSLQDAFRLISNLRAEHRVAQLRAGEEPDDHLSPDELSTLRRTQLREAFRAVAAIQRRLASELGLGVR